MPALPRTAALRLLRPFPTLAIADTRGGDARFVWGDLWWLRHVTCPAATPEAKSPPQAGGRVGDRAAACGLDSARGLGAAVALFWVWTAGCLPTRGVAIQPLFGAVYGCPVFGHLFMPPRLPNRRPGGRVGDCAAACGLDSARGLGAAVCWNLRGSAARRFAPWVRAGSGPLPLQHALTGGALRGSVAA